MRNMLFANVLLDIMFSYYETKYIIWAVQKLINLCCDVTMFVTALYL